tara:strand:- start:582 stop:1133 length:552 start_codon:yes stop_codon:yes gene_type:complete
MNFKIFYKHYFKNFLNLILDKSNILYLDKIAQEIKKTKKKSGKILVFGNGGSAAIASHFSLDLSNNFNVKCLNFNNAELITCFSNDFKYENWIKKVLEIHLEKKDIVILISSSGKSKNMIKAAQFVKKNKNKLFTFTGFSKLNPLRKLGNYNLWVNSSNYNQIENLHQIWLLFIVDYLKKITK